MNKEDIQINDILELRNGSRTTMYKSSLWIIEQYYNEDLTSKLDEQFDIVNIYRPTYELIYNRENENQIKLY